MKKIKSSIKNIVFDLGGVLVDLNRERAVTAYRELGYDASASVGLYNSVGCFGQMELGLITSSEFCDAIRKDAKLPVTNQQVFDASLSILKGLPAHRLEKLLQLKQKYHLYLLSNTNAIHWEQACLKFFEQAGLHVSDYFQQTFLSYQIHSCKPDLAIFQYMLEQTGMNPEESLFIDDSEANCKAAQQLGIQVHCVRETDDWLTLFDEE